MEVQWLRHHVSNAGGADSIPGWGIKIPNATWQGQIKKKKNPVGKKIANIAAVTKSGQKQIVSEMKVDKGILLEVLACAMKTRLKGLGCVFFLN